MRVLLLLALSLAVCGCELVYKLPTRQGNVLDQKQIDQLQIGMTRDQVKFLLGTPIAANPFREDRWDYTGYYKPPRGKAYGRTVSLYFADGKLVRMEGEKNPNGDKLAEPDTDMLLEQEEKAIQEPGRKDTGTSPPP